ncbi:pyrimidine operon attenuation protein / uracil phosphoribosyltransferase [Propionivibrio dicarboxylicus]|uniref:Pyrimidine operon attenuation protein / uracil phosphoribosyltransferase n=2 Tax=Propionivibrio dicarboxylicus TaxID=83767 RepID=A0A1G8GSC2_9RHOO|nr:pyrimidine operon attenuation protein / uracil phosphoribosyltransferase [Propionivibrio dicarboxylicus]
MEGLAMTKLQLPDAERQCVQLAGLIRPQLTPETLLVGIHTGGAWVARRLAEILKLEGRIGLLDISFYRDDFGKRGLHPQVKPTSLPLDIDGRPLILVDDVLFTGRTTRAAINELFDYGRPSSIRLAVLADRGAREIPVQADFCPWTPSLDEHQELVLTLSKDGRLCWRVETEALETSPSGVSIDAMRRQARACALEVFS